MPVASRPMSSRRRLLPATLAAAAVVACVAAPAQGAPGAVTTDGRRLVDGSGRTLLPHGLNVVAKLPPYTPESMGFGEDDAEFLARDGFTAVRLGVMYAGVEPRPGVYDERYLDSIAATATTLARHGIRSLLDFHQDQYNERFVGQGFPDWAVQDGGLANPQLPFPVAYVANPALQHALGRFFANAPGPGGVPLQDRYAAAWRHVARRFARVPGILGYDLMNEPFPGPGTASCLTAAGCPGFERGALTRFYRKVAAGIRTVDRRTPIFYESTGGFGLGAPTSLPLLRDRHAVFSWHLYATSAADAAKVFDRVRARAREPDVLTEFGSTADTAVIRRAAALADRHLTGWLEWTYFSNGRTDNPNTPSLVRDPTRPPRGDNVDTEQRAALVRPYARAVTGIPTRIAFDATTRRFTLRYRPRAGARALTLVDVPALVYPEGHRVTVSGGTIVRDRARLIGVRAAGAGTVTVTVGPRPL
jgi:endoglycosylceramidase